MIDRYDGPERRKSPRPEADGAESPELARRNARLETAMREFESLAHAVHHDFRLPIAAIENAARTLRANESLVDRDTARAVRTITEQLASMRAMSANLVELSRLSGQRLDLEPVDMGVLVREAWVCIRGTDRVQFSAGNLPSVLCHRGMLKLVWTILLSQAVSRCSRVEHSLVEVTGGCGGDHAVFGIRDNGRELDLQLAGKLSHVFELIQNQSPQPGVGIGLAIVQRIVTRHRGNVWVEANRERGALLQFSLPAEASA